MAAWFDIVEHLTGCRSTRSEDPARPPPLCLSYGLFPLSPAPFSIRPRPGSPTPACWWFSAGCFHGNMTFNCLQWALTFFFFFHFCRGAGWKWVCVVFFRGVISCFVCLLLGFRKLFEIRLQNCMFCYFSVKVFEEYFHRFQLCQLFRRQDCSLWNTWASLSFSDQIFLVLNFALKSFSFLRFSEPFEQNETPTLQVFFPGLQWCIMDLRAPQTHTQNAPQSDMFVLNIVI